MRTNLLKICIAFILFMTHSVAIARTYYVATDGNDNWPGTFDQPWATWQRAFDTAIMPGDTTFIRGGIYYVTEIQKPTTAVSGTPGNPVCFFAYPNETPILDGIHKTSPSAGVGFNFVNYVKIKGLTVRNHFQMTQNDHVQGMFFFKSGHVTVENCVIHDIGYRGFYFYDTDSIFVYNCDSYNIVDSLSVTPGNAGDGYIMSGGGDTTDYAIFRGCRAWHVSDDGWDVHTNGFIEIDSCWAFDCGGYEKYHYGNGMKLNLSLSLERNMLSRKVTNCILIYNRGSGLTTNDTDRAAIPMHIYNNTAAFNGTYGNDGFGFAILNAGSSGEVQQKRVYRNNVSYGNSGSDVFVAGSATYTHSHNSWDSGLSLDPLDFMSLDSTGIHGPRKANGSLPDLSGFFELRQGSGLIDAGMDVSLPFNGAAPDIGAKELNYQTDNNNTYPSVKITFPSNGSTIREPESVIIVANVYDAEGLIRKVEFFDGETKLGERTSEPWSFRWDHVPVGSHRLRVVAEDHLNARSTSSEVLVTYVQGLATLFPNPNNGSFTFVLPDPLQRTCEVFVISLDGKVIYRGEMMKEEIEKRFDLYHIASSMYTFILADTEGIIWRRFIKI